MPVVRVPTNGIETEVGVEGQGRNLVLLHGFPHTRRLWDLVVPELAARHRVLTPDLRGLGGSTRAAGGYDVRTLAADLDALLDAPAVGGARDRSRGAVDLVGIDLGAPAALAYAWTRPDRVRRLVVMESLAGTLPGAERFLAGGPPWWFGFHGVPGLAERVLAGHEDEYLDFFYRSGTHDRRGIDPGIRAAFVAAYRGSESLHCAFEHYRAMPTSARQIAALAAAGPLPVPTLAVGADTVGDALYRQLEPVAQDVRGTVVADCGHIVPLDRPRETVALLDGFLA